WREHPDPGCLLAPAIVHPTRNSSGNSFGLDEHHLEWDEPRLDPRSLIPQSLSSVPIGFAEAGTYLK
ncbi:hypothetical protein Tco_0093879, partial [Tanacetum coccineum]